MMRRRMFIAGLGSAAAWPVMALSLSAGMITSLHSRRAKTLSLTIPPAVLAIANEVIE